jgi:uncharacterized protein
MIARPAAAGPPASCSRDAVTVPPAQAETAAFLRALSGADPVETHISLVFTGADTVWKLKKAVRLPFLDFTGLADRRHFTEREYTLNAPAAPGLYRDVVPVTRQPDGTLTLGGAAGEVVDWVLRMARIPEGDFLDVMAKRGGLGPALLDTTADAVAAWHVQLPPIRDVQPDMREVALGNARSALDAGLSPDAVAAWRAAMLAELDRRVPWITRRAADGFVRRAHGDLHLGNLCLWQGRPVLFDALEFNEAMATIDLAYDLAFLLMDLEQRLDRAAANRVLNRYVARTGDAGLVHGLPAFLSMRAMVRAHVEARIGHPDQATRYLRAAKVYLQPCQPVVVAAGGLPATGKSTLARALAPCLGVAPGALVLRSDEIRKRLHGAPPEQRLPPEAYTPEVSHRVFAELADCVQRAAEGGHAVIADATFMDPRHRGLVEDAALRAGVPFHGLWLTAPVSVLEQRVAARRGDASDATLAVVRAAAARDPGPGNWRAIDATDAESAWGLASDILKAHIMSCWKRKPEMHYNGHHPVGS